MTESIHITRGWGIFETRQDIDGKVYTCLLGRYCYGHQPPPPQFDGYTTAVFRTRQEARDALKTHPPLKMPALYNYWERCRVQRVTVEVRPE
jgi:hypothetical protein